MYTRFISLCIDLPLKSVDILLWPMACRDALYVDGHAFEIVQRGAMQAPEEAWEPQIAWEQIKAELRQGSY